MHFAAMRAIFRIDEVTDSRWCSNASTNFQFVVHVRLHNIPVSVHGGVRVHTSYSTRGRILSYIMTPDGD